MSKFCINCGKELATDDKFCTSCGIEIKENETANENNPKVQAYKKKKCKKIIFIVAALILALICMLMSGNAGKLRGAKIFASLEKYGLAYDAISKSDSPKHEIHKKYYQFVSLAENLVSEKDASLFSSGIDNMTKIITMMEGNESELSDKERRIYDGICEAMNQRTERLKAKDSIQLKLTSISELQKQIIAFQSGETFTPKEIEEKAVSWQENVETANSLYKEIMNEFDLPQFDDIMSEITRILSSMREPEYYTQNNLYFTKYNSKYKSIYDEKFIKTVCFDLERKINWLCSVDMGIALFGDGERANPGPTYPEYMYSQINKRNGAIEEPKPNMNENIDEYNNPLKFYENFESILDFGNYLKKAPYSHETFDYYYSYDDEKDDIKGIINDYIEEMKLLGFALEGPVDQNSALEYKLNGEKYVVEVIDDYALEHIEIHIKNSR